MPCGRRPHLHCRPDADIRDRISSACVLQTRVYVLQTRVCVLQTRCGYSESLSSLLSDKTESPRTFASTYSVDQSLSPLAVVTRGSSYGGLSVALRMRRRRRRRWRRRWLLCVRLRMRLPIAHRGAAADARSDKCVRAAADDDSYAAPAVAPAREQAAVAAFPCRSRPSSARASA